MSLDLNGLKRSQDVNINIMLHSYKSNNRTISDTYDNSRTLNTVYVFRVWVMVNFTYIFHGYLIGTGAHHITVKMSMKQHTRLWVKLSVTWPWKTQQNISHTHNSRDKLHTTLHVMKFFHISFTEHTINLQLMVFYVCIVVLLSASSVSENMSPHARLPWGSI